MVVGPDVHGTKFCGTHGIKFPFKISQKLAHFTGTHYIQNQAICLTRGGAMRFWVGD